MSSEPEVVELIRGLRLVPITDVWGRPVRCEPWTDEQRAEFERAFKASAKVQTHLRVRGEGWRHEPDA